MTTQCNGRFVKNKFYSPLCNVPLETNMPFSDEVVTLAILSFGSTTVDDFCVILVFMAREYVKATSFADAQKAFVEISLGQTLGFSIIVVASLVIGLGLGAVVSGEYLALIGAAPVIIGFFKIQELRDDGECPCCGGAEDDDASLLAKSQSDGAAPRLSTTGFRDSVVGSADSGTAEGGIKLRRTSAIGGKLLALSRESSTRSVNNSGRWARCPFRSWHCCQPHRVSASLCRSLARSFSARATTASRRASTAAILKAT